MKTIYQLVFNPPADDNSVTDFDHMYITVKVFKLFKQISENASEKLSLLDITSLFIGRVQSKLFTFKVEGKKKRVF